MEIMDYHESYKDLDPHEKLVIDRAVSYIMHVGNYVMKEEEVLAKIAVIIEKFHKRVPYWKRNGNMFISIIDALTQ